MQGKIGLEEHFALPETAGDVYLGSSSLLKSRLYDVEALRLEQMDKFGMERMIISLNAPGVQELADAKAAIELAKKANDVLAEKIAKRADRFSGFAALPMQDPEAAARELERCVKEYKFVGAMVNGWCPAAKEGEFLYYDMPQFMGFWEAAEKLDVPFYLHPRPPSQMKAYEGHPWLGGPVYGFAAETGLHALRLICSGLFDRFPKLQVILGHLGEGMPFNLYRMDQRLAYGKWQNLPAKKKISEYFVRNFHITTSGNFRTQALMNSILEVGSDRIMFSTDYPMEEVSEAATWFDACDISEPDRVKIGRENALKLFKLGKA